MFWPSTPAPCAGPSLRCVVPEDTATGLLKDASALVREHMAVLGPAQAAGMFAAASGIAARVTSQAHAVELDELLADLARLMREAADATVALPSGGMLN